jgi:hypothetical protein
MAFEDDNILPAHQGEMVSDTAAADTTTNDDDLGMSGKI